MGISLADKQKWSIRRAFKRINIWHGSVRAGKTVGTIWRWIDYIANGPKGDLMMAGKTIDALKRNILSPMFALVGAEAEYYPGKRELHMWDRTIHVIGASDERSEGKIRGSTLAGFLGDETTLWPESFFKMALSRMSVQDAKCFIATNPDNPNHWLKVDYLDRKQELNAKNPNHIASFHFDIDDNPYLPTDYVEQLKAEYTGLWYKRFILGEWCVAEGAIYDHFDEKKHVISTCPMADYYTVGYDYGTTNPTWFGLFGHKTFPLKGEPRVWAEREYYWDPKKQKRQKTDDEFANDFEKFILPVQNKVQEIYGDPSAESFNLALRRRSITGLRDANNEVLDGIRTVGRMLNTGEYKISKNCKQLISEKYGYSWNEKAQILGKDEPKKENDHASDGERYDLHSKYGTQKYDITKFKD